VSSDAGAVPVAAAKTAKQANTIERRATPGFNLSKNFNSQFAFMFILTSWRERRRAGCYQFPGPRQKEIKGNRIRGDDGIRISIDIALD
jgi:hypothetical protein